jgi:hypothetical protein
MAAPNDALYLVTQFERRSGGSVWMHITRNDVAFDLRLRIDNPNMIDSSMVNLCGPAVFFRNLAIDDPVTYAKAGIDLYERSSCTIGSLTVSTDFYLWNSSAPRPMTGLDWMMLASLRNSENMMTRYQSASDVFAAITRPSCLESWFRAAGYRSVIDEAYIYREKSIQNEAHIRRAEYLRSAGYKLCLFISSNMLKGASQNIGSWIPDHWVVVDTPITIDGGNIRLDVFSWGDIVNVPEAGTLPVSDFLKNYYGFVAVKFRNGSTTSLSFPSYGATMPLAE